MYFIRKTFLRNPFIKNLGETQNGYFLELQAMRTQLTEYLFSCIITAASFYQNRTDSIFILSNVSGRRINSDTYFER